MGLDTQLREAEGLSEPVTIKGREGRGYSVSFRLLKHKAAHRVQFQLASPAFRVLWAFQGGTADLSELAGALDLIGFDRYWEIASALLDGAVVEGAPIGTLEDSALFRNQPALLLKALVEAVRVNFPFLAGALGGLEARVRAAMTATTTTPSEGSVAGPGGTGGKT